MKYYLPLFLFLALLLQAQTSSAAPTGINDQFQAQFLPENNALVLNPAQVKEYNAKIVRDSPSVYDLSEFPCAISAERLQEWLAPAARLLTDALYRDGQIIDDSYKQNLLSERNLAALPASRATAYAVVVRRANLRALPTADGLFHNPADSDFDILQETAVDPSEPAIVLHSSRSGNFKYVQTRNYRGWLAADDLAATTRRQWLRYVQPENFLVVTDRHFTLTKVSGESILYQMGALLPLQSESSGQYVVTVPTRGRAGELIEQKAGIAPNPALNVGFLPYTRNQVLRQSLKLLNAPYGWGGLKNSVDCSSFIANIYRSVGVELPRNADEQERTAGVHATLAGLTEAEKARRLQTLQIGDALFFDGHTMLYIGQSAGRPQIIHALGSCMLPNADGTLIKNRAMRVLVSDLSLRRSSGVTFAGALTSAVSYR